MLKSRVLSVQITQENAHYQGWASVLNSEDRERVLAKWRWTVTLRLTYKDEFRISKPNGETAWVFVQASPELDENGQILGYAGMALDISERILAEREITDARNRIDEKQRQLECAVENFSDGFMLFDADDRIVICNEYCRQDLMPIAEYLEPGQRFKDFARALFDSDEIIPEDYRTEESFQRRLDNHRNP